ncbi:DUF1775 domain-containing protein [Kineococcus sp. T13]|nr:DUF1775 domain-containing protein [Kineococcus vitellinus]
MTTTLPAAAATAAAALLLAAAPASAHVHAVPDATAADGYSVVTFRVPNESEGAATTSVQVQLPTDHPFTWVAVKPVAGWSATVAEGDLPAPVQVDGATVTKAPLTITWTAEAGASGIGVGQFEEFSADVGPLPAEGTRVVLPTVQTYADGEVSRWTEVADPGAEEPAEPAPEFTTTAAEDGHGAGAHAEEAAGAAGSGGSGGSAAGASGTSDALARGLGGAGLLLGLGALVVALLRRGGTARA